MRMAAAIVAFLVPLVIYICTLARAVTFVDSGELSAVFQPAALPSRRAGAICLGGSRRSRR